MLYAVYGTDVDRNYLLGFADGKQEDVEAYYNARKGYGLVLDPIEFTVIPVGYKAKKETLDKEIKKYEAMIKQLTKQIVGSPT